MLIIDIILIRFTLGLLVYNFISSIVIILTFFLLHVILVTIHLVRRHLSCWVSL